MNVNIPVRLPDNVITSLKAAAVGQNSSVSKILAESMQKVIDGEISITEQPVSTKATSISVEYKIAEQFKQYAEEHKIPVNKAYRLLAEKLAMDTAH